MFGKKNLVINCNLCDTRKMKEEDYKNFEKIVVNADMVLVNENSKGILNRLPLVMNQDVFHEVSDDYEVNVKFANGYYEITGNTMVQEHTALCVNGFLRIQPGTEAVLEKYEFLFVNGSVKCPQSLEGYLGKLSVNGSVSTYPDDCMILDATFTIDKYFPLRVREGKRYYAENMVIVTDTEVDLGKLVEKQVEFKTKRLLVPECMVEACAPLFDERVEFLVVPDGLKLLIGDIVLDEKLVEKEGGKLYVYGSAKLSEECDLEMLSGRLEKLVVTEDVEVKSGQKDAFLKLNAEYRELKIRWEGRLLHNKVRVRVDRNLLEGSPMGVRISNAVSVKITEDVTTEMILDKLSIHNCAHVSCSEQQESAVAVISENVAQIGEGQGEDAGEDGFSLKNLLSSKVVNANKYVL